MKYRRLGKTDLKISVIGLGTWQFGGEWGRDYQVSEVRSILLRASELGYNFIDTAECYGDHLSEQLIGQALRNHRKDFIIATKFGHRYTKLFEREDYYHPTAVLKQLEDSLRALKIDHIDLYQFHSGSDAQFNTPGLWEMLQKQVELGKIRFLGISIGSHQNIYQAEQAERIHPKVIQVVYNRLEREAEEKLLKLCQEKEIGVITRVPLASGLLSGKYSLQSIFPKNDVRNLYGQKWQQRAISQVEEILRMEVPQGMNPSQWALSWCLQHPAVACVIPGCKDVKQVEMNGMAADLELVSDQHPQAE